MQLRSIVSAPSFDPDAHEGENCCQANSHDGHEDQSRKRLAGLCQDVFLFLVDQLFERFAPETQGAAPMSDGQ